MFSNVNNDCKLEAILDKLRNNEDFRNHVKKITRAFIGTVKRIQEDDESVDKEFIEVVIAHAIITWENKNK